MFLLLLRRVRKEDRVCWRLCSSRRLREESLCVSSCLVVRKLALPPVPCVRTEPRHARICPGEPGEAMPTQVRVGVSKPHVLLQELITPLSLCSRKKNMRQVNCPYTNLLAKFSLGGAHILAYWRVFVLKQCVYKPFYFCMLLSPLASHFVKKGTQFRGFDL